MALANVSHLLWHRPTVYNGHFRGPDAQTPNSCMRGKGSTTTQPGRFCFLALLANHNRCIENVSGFRKLTLVHKRMYKQNRIYFFLSLTLKHSYFFLCTQCAMSKNLNKTFGMNTLGPFIAIQLVFGNK